MDSDEQCEKNRLFPCASRAKARTEPVSMEKWDWLSNQSFYPQTADAVTKLCGSKTTEVALSAQSRQKQECGSEPDIGDVSFLPDAAQCEHILLQSFPQPICDLTKTAQKTNHSAQNDSSDDLSNILKEESHVVVTNSCLDKEQKHRGHKRRKEHQREDSRRDEKRLGTRDSHQKGHHKKKKKKHKNYFDSSPERKRKKHKTKKIKHKDDWRKQTKELGSLRKRPSSIWIDDIGSVPAQAFFVDERSDRNNLCFDSLNFKDVALYKRLGKSCLGIDPDKQYVIWKRQKSGKGKMFDNNVDRYFEKPLTEERIPVLQTKNFQQRNHTGKSDGKSSEMSYIPLPAACKLEETSANNSEVDPLGVYDISTKQYLSDVSISADQSVSDRGGVRTPKGCSISERVVYYNRHLQENPHDIQKWLEFVHFQDQAAVTLHIGLGSKNESAKSSRRDQMITEKKLSILEKALKVNPASPVLQLEQLELCRELWDTTKLAKQWQSLIRQHSENLLMWQQYLLFRQTCFAKFTVSSVTSLHSDFMKAMQVHGTEFKLDLVLQVCQFWRQSGHTEKAVAVLQALVEFNSFCPDHIGDATTLEGKIAFFEPFWDSNEVRFGQTGAEGWNKWMHRKEKGGWSNHPKQDSKDTEDESKLDGTEPKWQAWLQEEIHREHTHFMPWLPNDGQTEDDCEDPDRMVVFDDISLFLFNLDTTEQKFELITRFLHFLGVGTWKMAPSRSGDAGRGHDLMLENPTQVFANGDNMMRMNAGGVVSGNGELLMPLSHEGNKMVVVSDVGHNRSTSRLAVHQFANNIIDQALTLFPKEAQNQLCLLQIQLNLGQVDRRASSKQRRRQMKDAQKYAKTMLSQDSNRNNLRLWEVYARWEWCNGNETESQRIFETALAFSSQNHSSENDNSDITRLLSSYATLKLGIGFYQPQPTLLQSQSSISDVVMQCSWKSKSSTDDVLKKKLCKQEVLHALTTLGEGGKFSPLSATTDKTVSAAHILKARKGYVDLYNRVVQSYKSDIHNIRTANTSAGAEMFRCVEWTGSYFVHTVLCYAFFQYLSVSIQAAGVVFEETLSTLEALLQYVDASIDDADGGAVHSQLELDCELVMVQYVRVMSHYVHRHPVPLTTLRNLIQRALRRYGDNSELLDTVIGLEARSNIAGRLRRYFDRVTSEATNPMPWLFAIRAEMLRMKTIGVDQHEQNMGYETGIAHRLRSLFDRATLCRHARHCVLLWRLYLHFEVQQGNVKRAKAIFYRALQHCPWAKVLYLDAVRYFEEELQEVLDLLMEKELRVRAPLEEVELLMQVARNKQNNER